MVPDSQGEDWNRVVLDPTNLISGIYRHTKFGSTNSKGFKSGRPTMFRLFPVLSKKVLWSYQLLSTTYLSGSQSHRVWYSKGFKAFKAIVIVFVGHFQQRQVSIFQEPWLKFVKWRVWLQSWWVWLQPCIRLARLKWHLGAVSSPAVKGNWN